jgi:hypothetical protein
VFVAADEHPIVHVSYYFDGFLYSHISDISDVFDSGLGRKSVSDYDSERLFFHETFDETQHSSVDLPVFDFF